MLPICVIYLLLSSALGEPPLLFEELALFDADDEGSGDPNLSSTSSSSSSTTSTTLLPPIPHHIVSSAFSWTPDNPKSIEVTVDEGYMISVTVEKINLNGDDQDFLVIKSGDSLEDTSDSGRMFTYSISKPVKYLFNTNRVFGYYFDAIASDDAGEFTIIFERFGELTTSTTTLSTTTIDLPTTQTNDSTEITVYIAGTTMKEFTDDTIIEDLRKCIVAMATAYCKDNQIRLLQEITTAYVLIKKIVRCPYHWPDSETCVKTTFSLPIFYDSTKWSGYQMDTVHLEQMWSEYAEQYLDSNFEIYNAPNVNKIVKWWAIGITVVVILLIIILIAIRFITVKFLLNARRRLSDTLSIVSKRKDSDISLSPHYLQDTPKLFDNKYPLMDTDF